MSSKLYLMFFLATVVSMPLKAHEPELRRSTSVQLVKCSSAQFNQIPLPKTKALLNHIFSRIVRANPDVFQGDLSPDNICLGPDQADGQRAWAEADKRSAKVEAGMILRVQNEAQLAFVVAHELAHLSLRHTPLEGNPIPGSDRPVANQLLLRQQQLFQQLITVSKRDQARMRELQRQHQDVQTQIEDLFVKYFDTQAAANWMETEADVTGAIYYLRAGYPREEISWRIEQIAVALKAAGLDPRTQQHGPGYDPHGAPSAHPAPERERMAFEACGLGAAGDIPPRGIHRYPSPCWQIWNLKINLPSTSMVFAEVLARANPKSFDQSLLMQAKAEICATASSGLKATYCR